MTAGPVRVDVADARPSLVGEGQPPPPPPVPPGASGSSAPAGAPGAPATTPSGYDEAWVRRGVILVCNALAEQWGPAMRATELELGFAVPCLHGFLQRTAPAFMSGESPDANLWVLGGIVLYMGARRVFAVGRARRLASTATRRPPAQTGHHDGVAGSAPGPGRGGTASPSAAPSPAHRPSGAFGTRGPVILGGQLGDGRRLA